MPNLAWHLITGEYPPKPGGIGDYSRLVAEGFACAGHSVHVWTGGTEGTSVEPSGVIVHRVAGRFHKADLARLNAEIDKTDRPRRLLIQYVPHSYGFRAMNVGFCRWVERRRKSGDDVWTMFHEVRVEFRFRDRLDIWITAAVTRWMARHLLRTSSRVFIAIPAWEQSLAPLKGMAPVLWLPVPSNIPRNNDAAAVQEIREHLASGSTTVIGTFGTYSQWIREQLRQVFHLLLDVHPDRIVWILGRSGDQFAAELLAERPDLAGRIVGPGMLSSSETSLHLQGCDILVQPYPDGVSSRRGSVMAALAHGRTVVSTFGHLTEPFWSETQAISLAPPGEPRAMAAVVERLLADPVTCAAMSRQAIDLYESRFAVERTVEALLQQAQG